MLNDKLPIFKGITKALYYGYKLFSCLILILIRLFIQRMRYIQILQITNRYLKFFQLNL